MKRSDGMDDSDGDAANNGGEMVGGEGSDCGEDDGDIDDGDGDDEALFPL